MFALVGSANSRTFSAQSKGAGIPGLIADQSGRHLADEMCHVPWAVRFVDYREHPRTRIVVAIAARGGRDACIRTRSMNVELNVVRRIWQTLGTQPGRSSSHEADVLD